MQKKKTATNQGSAGRREPTQIRMAPPESPVVRVRCYQELGDRLPPSCRGRSFPVSIRDGTTLGSLLALLQLPREEVDLALINGCSVGTSHPLRDGDLVSLYPVFESLDITPLSRLRRTPLRRLRFLADNGLEDLAELLARAGQEARKGCGRSRTELARQSLEQGDVLLTRDPGLIRKHGLEKAYVVRASSAAAQLREVLRRFHLDAPDKGSPGDASPGNHS